MHKMPFILESNSSYHWNI